MEAGSGVMNYLEEKGLGFDVGVGLVPIVWGASLFDLGEDAVWQAESAFGFKAVKDFK